MASACILIIYLAVLLSVVKLRLRNKEENKNSFKAPGGWVTPIVGIASIIWLLTSLGKWEILSTAIFMSVVSLIYFLSNKLIIKTKPDIKKA